MMISIKNACKISTLQKIHRGEFDHYLDALAMYKHLSRFMNTEFAEIKNTILSFGDLLPERMKKYIHYKSMRNFVLHFDEIRGEITREKIIKLLSSYIEEERAKDYDFSEKEESLQLARKY